MKLIGSSVRPKSGKFGRRQSAKITKRFEEMAGYFSLFESEMQKKKSEIEQANLSLKAKKKKLLPLPDDTSLKNALIHLDNSKIFMELAAYEAADMELDKAEEKLRQILGLNA